MRLTIGNTLLARTPSLSYLTGDYDVDSSVEFIGMEVEGGGVTGLGITTPFPLFPATSSSPFVTSAIRSIRQNFISNGAATAATHALSAVTAYRVRTAYRKPLGSNYTFQSDGDVLLFSAWSQGVMTLLPRCARPCLLCFAASGRPRLVFCRL